jgi:hypothetical protein
MIPSWLAIISQLTCDGLQGPRNSLVCTYKLPQKFEEIYDEPYDASEVDQN